MKKPVYLDYNATTPLDPDVFERMKPFFEEEFGNASSSSHAYGWGANMAVEKARKQVASVIGAQVKEIIWTSGATESNNMSILGTLLNFVDLGETPHVISSPIEHKAVLDVCRMAQRLGCEVDFVKVDSYGRALPDEVKKLIKPNTRLISFMMGNNEIGTLNPIKELGELAEQHEILFHTDAAQTAGKCPIDVKQMKIDLLSISGHKIYGPKGIGALYINKSANIEMRPIMCGGAQENGIRPGTLNVPGIVGLGAACEIAFQRMDEDHNKLQLLQKKLIERVLGEVPEAQLNGHPDERLCNNVSFSFKGLSADMFALGLSGLACSSGSACTSADGAPSHVLKGIGLEDDLARATLRVGLGRFTEPADIDLAADKIIAMVQKNRKISAV